MKHQTVVLTGGGTAGHVTPLLAVAKALLDKSPSLQLVYIGQRGDKNISIISSSNLPITIKKVMAGKYRRYHGQSIGARLLDSRTNLLNLRDVFITIIGFIEALILLLRIRPMTVFTKGGFASLPTGVAAGLLGLRMISHDSDVLPGLANRLISRFVDIHTVATKAEYPYPKAKTIIVGVPVQAEYAQYAEKDPRDVRSEIDVPMDCRLLFIGGSSQGARIIDDAMEAVVPKLLEKYQDLVVIQVFGRLNESSMNSRYKSLDDDLKKRLQLFTFLSDNYRYFAAADVIVGRAGATFLAEAATLSKACLIIPAAQLAGGHQLENAETLRASGATEVIYEDSLSVDNLENKLSQLLDDPKLRRDLGLALHRIIATDAANKIADLVIQRDRK